MKTFLLLVAAVLIASADDDEIISVHRGEDVTLTGPDCSGNDSVTLERSGGEKPIYSCIDGHAIRPEHQDPSFVGRVEGLKCPTKDGNVSATLKNVTREDAGEYEWFWKNGTGTFNSTVYLEVTDPGAADGGTTSGNPPDVGAIVVGIVAVLMIVMIVFSVYLCYGRFRYRLPCRPSDQQNSELFNNNRSEVSETSV